MKRDLIFMAAGVAAVGAGLLVYALLGEPSSGFWSPMKIAVGGSCAMSGWVLYRVVGKWPVLPLCLAGLGAMTLLAKMSREEWAKWDWATVLGLSIACVWLLVLGIRSREVDG